MIHAQYIIRMYKNIITANMVEFIILSYIVYKTRDLIKITYVYRGFWITRISRLPTTLYITSISSSVTRVSIPLSSLLYVVVNTRYDNNIIIYLCRDIVILRIVFFFFQTVDTKNNNMNSRGKRTRTTIVL